MHWLSNAQRYLPEVMQEAGSVLQCRAGVRAHPLGFELQGVAVTRLFPVIHCMLCCTSTTSYLTTYETYPKILQQQDDHA